MKLTCYRTWMPLLAATALIAACGGGQAPSNSDRGPSGDGPVPAVEVIQARSGSLPLQERLSGTVRAENQVAIYPEISAPIVRVVAGNGDYVRKGDALVYLKDTDFQERLRQAEAALVIAEAEARRAEATVREMRARLERTSELASKQLESQQQLEALQAQVDIAVANYDQAIGRISQAQSTVEERRDALGRTVVRAPISGHIGQRDAEVGMRVDTGTHLFTIGKFDVVRVEVAIPDEMIALIKTGQTALIGLEGVGDQELEASVSRISPFLEEGSYSAEAEIDVDNRAGFLRPGMFVTVDILYGESEQATLLPMSVLYEDPGSGVQGVFIASSLRAETPLREPVDYDKNNPPPLTEPTPMTFREITVRARGRGLVGIDGVEAGDWVVTVGQNLLSGKGNERVFARARPVTWGRIGLLQELQDQDLLRQFMEKQQRLARDSFRVPTAPDSVPAAVVRESPAASRP
jgi:RND family efflux transporter MFP subunit